MKTPESRNRIPENPNSMDTERRRRDRDAGFREVARRTRSQPESTRDRDEPEQEIQEQSLQFQRATTFQFRVKP